MIDDGRDINLRRTYLRPKKFQWKIKWSISWKLMLCIFKKIYMKTKIILLCYLIMNINSRHYTRVVFETVYGKFAFCVSKMCTTQIPDDRKSLRGYIHFHILLLILIYFLKSSAICYFAHNAQCAKWKLSVQCCKKCIVFEFCKIVKFCKIPYYIRNYQIRIVTISAHKNVLTFPGF